ncbi:hypothetical protein DMS28_14950 [Klebsiella variicola]|nr:hypothetical protein DMR84_04230 [Klebsiella variicola]PXL22058.1 hypothetical protein DMS28_14950 [Klebsiella variicola]PXL31618.1 hypothetical protein DMS26_08590 [Klebsiella variicola]
MFGRATTSMLVPGRLRSRLIFCVMSLMAPGAHRGRPVAAAPCTPGLRPAKSPLRGPFDLSLQAAPAFRERLSDFEAASTGSFSRASG